MAATPQLRGIVELVQDSQFVFGRQRPLPGV
jgi:hypothetical protein